LTDSAGDAHDASLADEAWEGDGVSEPVQSFLNRLLQQVEPTVTLEDIACQPDRPVYQLRLQLPGVVSKDFTVPVHLVDAAPGDPVALDRLRRVLASAVMVLRTERRVAESRDELAVSGHDPRCPVCLRTIGPGAPVAFRHGEILHLGCSQSR
jgi:hypothetical protein